MLWPHHQFKIYLATLVFDQHFVDSFYKYIILTPILSFNLIII